MVFALPSKSGGLSPLARGNQGQPEDALDTRGPIPARAGESAAKRLGWVVIGAYPRSRGGIDTLDRIGHNAEGLSPLARGNPNASMTHRIHLGPIPARAGESAP